MHDVIEPIYVVSIFVAVAELDCHSHGNSFSSVRPIALVVFGDFVFASRFFSERAGFKLVFNASIQGDLRPSTPFLPRATLCRPLWPLAAQSL